MKYAVYVKPGSKKGSLVERDESGQLVVYVRERAVDGKATQAMLETVAKYLNVPKTSVVIVSGHVSRHKILDVK
jgi:uncharacterized protein